MTDLRVSSGGCEKWLEPKYILKVAHTRFSGRLRKSWEKKERGHQFLAQTMGSMELSLMETGKTTGGSGMYVSRL